MSSKQEASSLHSLVVPLGTKQEIRTFFDNAITYFRQRHRVKCMTAPRRSNRRTRPLIESEREELTRALNMAVRLMDIPEARQYSAWWAERDDVLALWEKANAKERPNGEV